MSSWHGNSLIPETFTLPYLFLRYKEQRTIQVYQSPCVVTTTPG